VGALVTAEAQRAIRAKRKRDGLCYQCGEPAMFLRRLCEKHNADNNARSRRRNGRTAGIGYWYKRRDPVAE
jgi:hypothetical protein